MGFSASDLALLKRKIARLNCDQQMKKVLMELVTAMASITYS